MGCVFVLVAGIFPRLGLFIVWLARPGMVDAAFDTWIWPLLGFLFLPFTTLIYVVLWQPGGMQGWDWFWIAIAVMADVAHWGTSWSQRRTAPGYPSTV